MEIFVMIHRVFSSSLVSSSLLLIMVRRQNDVDYLNFDQLSIIRTLVFRSYADVVPAV